MKQIFKKPKVWLIAALLMYSVILWAQIDLPDLPDGFDPKDPSNLSKWAFFFIAVAGLVLNYLANGIWPAAKKHIVLIRSAIIFIVMAIAIVTTWGASPYTIIQLLVGYFTQVFAYDKILNPLGAKSRVKYQRE